jgi:signal transduction histidine kinase
MRIKRLHVQFYLAIVVTLAVFLFANVLFWSLTATSRSDAGSISAAAQLAKGLLPPASASAEDQQRAIDDLHRRLNIDLVLYDATGQLLASAGKLGPLKAHRVTQSGWAMARGGPVWILALDDGRKLAVRAPHSPRDFHTGIRAFAMPVFVVLAFALGAYPIARRLTRRLARLQRGVETFGAGNLTARVAVEGSDEVAALAKSFNDSADRIADLVKSHKLLLANCSHELRTPLARLRLGLERVSPHADPAVREELRRNIAELDALIGEMLLASRLDTLKALEHVEDVDLLALAAEEASHFDRQAEGEPVIVRGDPALLRRLVRNLLDNAQRYAGGATRIDVRSHGEAEARVIVEDAGDGITESEREKIFEPFYRSESAQGAARGFGLGLALVRQIARAHGGEVVYAPLPGKAAGAGFDNGAPSPGTEPARASSEQRGGSRFVVTLAKQPRTQ